MSMNAETVIAVATPALGPAVITLFGIDFPILAITLSVVGLVLARYIAPPPKDPLTTGKQVALTTLLVIILIMIIIGEFGNAPLGVGMAVAWGIGLGFSGMLIIEIFGTRVVRMLKTLFGQE